MATQPHPGSLKSLVIERLFFDRWDERTRSLSDPAVTADALTETIARLGIGRVDHREPAVPLTEADVERLTLPSWCVGLRPLSTRGPGNFLKDILRSPRRNAIFPRAVFERGYTVRAGIGPGRLFEFVAVRPGTKEPFEDRFFDDMLL